ncbi:hypothetical protein [Demequina pelophila]|uniref:hypothetical protein n=1 Tax=Demequina pelophila TaxID=1638984 RepID=UPI0007849C75|nr:hypothetical protein [Demequina pelophila]
MDTLLEVIGWIGSILVVASLTQARVWRFRWMNLAGSLIATAYNAIFGIWPYFAMNLAIVFINIYWLIRLSRERHDAAVFGVLELDPADPYLQHLLTVHAKDIAKCEPRFAADAMAGSGRRRTYLVVRGDEAVGVVAVRDQGDGVGRLELDWVKPRFRDFTPGEFVHRESGILTKAGFRRLEVEVHEGTDRDYLERMGFAQQGERLVKALP